MAVLWVLLAAHDRHTALLDPQLQSLYPDLEFLTLRNPAVEHMPLAVIEGAVVRTASQLVAEE